MSEATPLYQTSHIRRVRATKAEMAERHRALLDIVAEMKPMTVRQLFYQATVRGIVEKTEGGYSKVQTDTVTMRRAGIMPYEWLADSTRWARRPQTFGTVEEALRETDRTYRKALWRNSGCHVEVWLEKDALAGVVSGVTEIYDVALMVARGPLPLI